MAASSQAAALTSEELSPVVNAAIELWAAAGISPAELDELRQVTVRITDLPGAYLGLSAPDTVYIDPNADGYGWFIDADPQDGRAFTSTGPGGEMVATQASPAWGHIDLLTVVAHELGHQLGLGDDASDDLMGEFLSLGVRRLPDGPGLHSGAIAPTGSPTTVTTALAASAGTTTRATILAARQRRGRRPWRPICAAVDLALQSGWGTDETESNPGPAGPIVIGIAPSGMTNGPARRHDRRALRRPARAGAHALPFRRRTTIGSPFKKTAPQDLADRKLERGERS